MKLKENNSSLKPINVFLENKEELESYKKVLDELVSQTKLEIIYHICSQLFTDVFFLRSS